MMQTTMDQTTKQGPHREFFPMLRGTAWGVFLNPKWFSKKGYILDLKTSQKRYEKGIKIAYNSVVYLTYFK